MYPVMLDVRNRTCLVVGGGGVALRKVQGLLEEGARVTVVTPNPISSLSALSRAGQIELRQRAYQSGDIQGFLLVFAATNDPVVNRQVYGEAETAGIWVNVADAPELCSFQIPARVRRGLMQLIVASGGGAPFVVRRMRQLLEKLFGPEWSEWMDAAAEFRKSVRSRDLSLAEEQRAYDLFFSATVDSDRLVVRVPSTEEVRRWLSRTEVRPAKFCGREELPDQPEKASSAGFVSLVGAGPGDAGLLTVRGRQRLLQAQAIVYDHLAETVLPCSIPPHVELHPVGKKAGYHPVSQNEINELLLRLARSGKRVVRLKGGDPFVFGRGGEEAEVLAAANIPFEIVPCVTSGIAVPAYAGIPVTHRGEAVRLSLVTAHESVKKQGAQVRWDLLAQDKCSSLVGFMGVTNLGNVVSQLISGGMDPKTPAAMIERGTTCRQRTVTSQLSEFEEAVRKSGIQPPAVFVIGQVVEHAKQLSWFDSRPLIGERLVAVEPSSETCDLLELAGVDVVSVTLPVTPAARVVIDALPVSGCIFRNPDEVDALDEERDRRNWGSSVIAWCLGEGTAKRASRRGWQEIRVFPESTETNYLIEVLRKERFPQFAGDLGKENVS